MSEKVGEPARTYLGQHLAHSCRLGWKSRRTRSGRAVAWGWGDVVRCQRLWCRLVRVGLPRETCARDVRPVALVVGAFALQDGVAARGPAGVAIAGEQR